MNTLLQRLNCACFRIQVLEFSNTLQDQILEYLIFIILFKKGYMTTNKLQFFKWNDFLIIQQIIFFFLVFDAKFERLVS